MNHSPWPKSAVELCATEVGAASCYMPSTHTGLFTQQLLSQSHCLTYPNTPCPDPPPSPPFPHSACNYNLSTKLSILSVTQLGHLHGNEVGFLPTPCFILGICNFGYLGVIHSYHFCACDAINVGLGHSKLCCGPTEAALPGHITCHGLHTSAFWGRLFMGKKALWRNQVQETPRSQFHYRSLLKE